MIRIVKIKFRPAGRHYDFNAQNFTLNPGDRVVVETDRGRALGVIVAPPRDVERHEGPEELKSILRHAGADDLNMANTNAARELDAFRFCRLRIAERKMEMKLVRAEYLFDGSKIIFYFTADGRIDFRELVKDLAHHFHTRIEMRQIGVRDEAKLCGGLGVCGRELCCCTFLTDFAPVSVKMAKEQGLALNPGKISGQCGRLLCCLAYEYETYCDLRKALPKCGKRIQIEGREGEVLDQSLLRQTVLVAFDNGEKLTLTAAQIEKGELPPRFTAAGNTAGQSVDAPPAARGDGRGRDQQGQRQSGRGDGNDRRQRPQGGERPSGNGRPAPPPPPKPAAAPKATQPPRPAPPSAPSKPQAPPQPAPPPVAVPPTPAEGSAAETEQKRRRSRNRRRPKRKPTSGTSGE